MVLPVRQDAPVPTASIIINTYNRGPWLDDAIRALGGLDYPAYEVIVVNGPSTDNSAEVIAGWGDRIKALTCSEPNLALSRNVGIAAASGEIIAFIDDDAVPHPQWLRRLALAYADPDVGAAGGYTIDNSGTAWQVRKTLCDRFGGAHAVTDFFDERPLNRPGTPYYPSLLGTNSSFRSSALRAIGGFDHAFAYLLDETDVCLRLVDAGWRVLYEPRALVYHQFAASHIRSPRRVARTLFPSARSKGYFIARHGMEAGVSEAAEALTLYRTAILESNRRMAEGGTISAEHRHSLDEDLLQGLDEGRRLAMARGDHPLGDLDSLAGDTGLTQACATFRAFRDPAGRRARRIVLVSQGWPPANESGIARWTALMARGLVEAGWQVHVLTKAAEPAEAADAARGGGASAETVTFENGLWLHRLVPDVAAAAAVVERYAIPHGQAAWAARVWREVQYLKSFGIDIASFPIWDLEGLPLLDDTGFVPVVSLHTTFAMARPFKPEWSERPLLAHAHVDRIIRAEQDVVERAPHLLANSQAIIAAVQDHYGVDLAGRAGLAPHGTQDPFPGREAQVARRQAARDAGEPLRVLFLGRFEERKGFDIAVDVALAVRDMPGVRMDFAGGRLDEAVRRTIARLGAEAILEEPRIRFRGELTRDGVDDAYVDADVVVMPSRFESFGLVAIEAMAAGCAVLALDAGGLGEVAVPAHGARAFADGAGVAMRIADEIAMLAQDRAELSERARLARAAWEAQFSVAAMTRAAIAWYEDILGNAAQGAPKEQP